jgi:hypothetical protein
MSDTDEQTRLLQLFVQRERQCRIEHRAYDIWLSRLTPLKWLTIGGGTILSALAGATVLGKPEFLGAQWPIFGGVCALASSILTGLHTALKCESHQTECHRLIQLFSSLEASFQAAQALPTSQLQEKFKELEPKFEEARMKATASPPAWCRKRAEREITNDA